SNIIEIDISEGFLYSNSQCVYIVDETVQTVSVSNEIGEFYGIMDVHQFDEETRYITLFDVFKIQTPEIESLAYNTLYPLKELSLGEYSIQNGVIIFDSYYKGKATIDRVIVEPLVSNVVSGINNTKRIS